MKKLISIVVLITCVLLFLVVFTTDSKPEYKTPIGITPEGAKVYYFSNSGDRIYVIHYENSVHITVAH